VTAPLLGIVTIGQSPRPDLVSAFSAYAPGARIAVRGALDEVTPGQLDAWSAMPTDYPLLVRLADGTTREVGRELLHPRVVAAAAQLAADGAAAVVVACAGDFPDVPSPVPVVLPGRLIPAVVRAVAPHRRIGIVTPVQGQVAAATAKWRSDGFDPVVTWAAPDDDEALDRAASALRESDVPLIVLDCMGHADDAAHRLEVGSGIRVLLAQTLVARVAGELVRAPAPAAVHDALESAR